MDRTVTNVRVWGLMIVLWVLIVAGNALAVVDTFNMSMRGLQYSSGAAVVPPNPQVGGNVRNSGVQNTREILVYDAFSSLSGTTISSTQTSVRFHVTSSTLGSNAGLTTSLYKPATGSLGSLSTYMYDTYDVNTPWSNIQGTMAAPISGGWYTIPLGSGGSYLTGELQAIATSSSNNMGFILAGEFGSSSDYMDIDSVQFIVDHTPQNIGASITTQPDSINRALGQTATFTVVAAGYPLPMYQWRKDGNNIPGATAPSLTIGSVTYAHAGMYDCFVSNINGSQWSSPRRLSIGAAPSDMALSNNSTTEAGPYSKSIGRLSSTDADGGIFTYSIVMINDYNWFEIRGDSLCVQGHLDYENKADYTVTIKSTDQGLNAYNKTFTVTASNINEAPTSIYPNYLYAKELTPAGAGVAKLTANDPDVGDVVTYSFASDSSSDNAQFVLVGDSLKTNAVFNYEVKNSYRIRVKATDAGSLSYTSFIYVGIQDSNEAPTNIVLSKATIAENQDSVTNVGTLSAVDPDFGGSFTYTLLNQGNYLDFNIAGNMLQSTRTFYYPTDSLRTIWVWVSDNSYPSDTITKMLTIHVTDGPSAAILQMPADSGVLSSYGQVLVWNHVNMASDTFSVEVASTASFGASVVWRTDTVANPGTPLDSMVQIPAALTVDNIYYWRVKGRDATGPGVWSDVRLFKIRPMRIWDNDGGNMQWSTAANWKPDGVPVSTDDVVFGPLANASCSLTVAVSVANIRFENAWTGSFKFGGKKLTVTGDLDASSRSSIFTPAGGDTLMFSPATGKTSIFSMNYMGSGTLPTVVKNSLGSLKLKGHGIATPQLSIQGGAFSFDTSYGSYTDTVQNLTVSGGAAIDFGEGTFKIGGNADLSGAGTITWPMYKNPGLSFSGHRQHSFKPHASALLPQIQIGMNDTLNVVGSGFRTGYLNVGYDSRMNVSAAAIIETKSMSTSGASAIFLGTAAVLRLTAGGVPYFGQLKIRGSAGTVELAPADSALGFNPWGVDTLTGDTSTPSVRIAGAMPVNLNGNLRCRDLRVSSGSLVAGMSVSLTVQRAVIVDGGTLNCSQSSPTMKSFSMSSGAFVGSASGITVDSAFSVTGGTLNPGTKLFLTGASDTGIFNPGTPMYSEVNIARPAGGWKLTSSLTAGYLKVNSGYFSFGSGFSHMIDSLRAITSATNINFGSSSVTTRGNVDFSGLNNCIAGTGSLVFAGTGTQNFIPVQALKMPSLIHSGSGTVNISVHTQAVSFTQSAGTFNFSAKSLTCDSAFTVSGGQLAGIGGATLNAWRFALSGTAGAKLNLSAAGTCTMNMYGPGPAIADYAILRGMSIIGPKYGLASPTCIDSGSNSNWGFTKIWAGTGPDWGLGSNWVGGTVPGALDSVVVGASSYDLNLNVDTLIRALTVSTAYNRPFAFGSHVLSVTGTVDLRGASAVNALSGGTLRLPTSGTPGLRKLYSKSSLQLPLLAVVGQESVADTILAATALNLPSGMSLNHGVFNWGNDSTLRHTVSRISGTMASGLMLFGASKVAVTGDSTSFGFQVNALPKATLSFNAPFMQNLTCLYTDTLPLIIHNGIGTLKLVNRFRALGFVQDSGSVDLSGIDTMRIHGPLTVKTAGGSILGLSARKFIAAGKIGLFGKPGNLLDLNADSLLTIAASDTVVADYVRIGKCAVTGTKPVIAKASCIDLGGNSGWSFVPRALFSVVGPLSGVAPYAVTVFDSSTGSISRRIWSWGDGTRNDTVALGGGRSHTFANPGSFVISLRVEGSAGIDSAKSGTIVVAGSAKAGFGAAVRTGVDSAVVAFRDSSSGAISKWIWSYGDGKTDSFTVKTNPTHIYRAVGVFTVRQIVVASGKTDTLTRTAYITVTDGSAPSAPASLTLRALSSSSVQVSWTPSLSADAKELVFRLGLDSANITDTTKDFALIIRPNAAGSETVDGLPAWGVKLYAYATSRDSTGLVSLPRRASVLLPDGVAPVNAVIISLASIGDTSVRLTVKTTPTTKPGEKADSIRIATAYPTAPDTQYTLPYRDTMFVVPGTVTRGWYTAQWTASDVAGNVSPLRSDSVLIVNAPPHFNIPGAVIIVNEDTIFQLTDIVRDPNLDPVTVSILSAPSGFELLDSSAALARWALSWLPGNADVGTHNVVLAAEDGQGGADTLSLTVTVRNVNDAPHIVELLLLDTVWEDSLIKASLIGSDIDAGDSVGVSVGGASWMTVGQRTSLSSDADTLFQWTLSGKALRADTGLRTIVFALKDKAGTRDTLTRTVFVYKTHHAPVARISGMIVAGGAVRISVSGSGDGDTALSYTVTLSGPSAVTPSQQSGPKGLYDFYPLADGLWQVSVVATDALTFSSAAVQDTFTIAGASSGTFPAGGWAMISVPGTPPASLLPAGVRIARWDESISPDAMYQYYRHGAVAVGALNPGSAYWVKLDSAIEVAAPLTTTLTSVSVPLLKAAYGWNQIASPWPYPVKLADTDSLWEWDAVKSALVEAGTVMYPWKGYWLQTDTARELVMMPGPFFGTRAMAKVAKAAFTSTEAWSLSAILSSDRGGDEVTMLGVSSLARSGIDKSDRDKPPQPGDAPTLCLVQAADSKRPFARVLHEPIAGMGVGIWTLRADRGEASPGSISFALEGTGGSFPYSVYIGSPDTLFEYAAGATVALDPTLSSQLRTVFVTADRNFMNTFPRFFSSFAPYPNPCRGRANIRYVLPYQWGGGSGYPVKMLVYDLKGRLIRTLVNEVQAYGHHLTQWDGSTDAGMSASSGYYLIHLSAGPYNSVQRLVIAR